VLHLSKKNGIVIKYDLENQVLLLLKVNKT
jgi:hypothetical protein